MAPSFDFSRLRITDDQPTQRSAVYTIPHSKAEQESDHGDMLVEVKEEFTRPDSSSRLVAALSSSGYEEEASDDEDVLTAQFPGPVGPLGPLGPVGCNYAITYENVHDQNCAAGQCGKQIVYDITGVTATGAGCPATLDGLRVTERVTNNHGCSPATVQTGAGCDIEEHPPMLPGHGIVRDCTDIYGVCLGSVSRSKIPAAGCDEVYTQELFVGGVLAEVHTITFHIVRSGTGCNGTVNRS